MATGQGFTRLRKGIVRTIYPHEMRRGYLFLSMDRSLTKILDTSDFEVAVSGQVYPSRHLDAWGRFSIPAESLRRIGTSNEIRIAVSSKKRLDVQVLRTNK